MGSIIRAIPSAFFPIKQKIFLPWAYFAPSALNLSDSPEKMSMKCLIIFIFACLFVAPDMPAEGRIFRDQKASLIQWDDWQPRDWVSFWAWRKDLEKREASPNWEKNRRESSLREAMGRMIACVGECRLVRGLGYVGGQYLSSIKEGDELLTFEDSYAWVYMFDGTLIRIAPHSSISFKEINLGVKETFLHARLNQGNIFWYSRPKNSLLEDNKRQTDGLFMTLEEERANITLDPVKLNEKDLLASLEQPPYFLRLDKRLNKLIRQNNRYFNFKPTISYLVMPNGTVQGKNMNAEFIVQPGKESYIKQRTHEQLRLKGEGSNHALTFHYRGYENKKKFKVEAGTWYEVDASGRDIHSYNGELNFKIGEFVTRKIPSILIVREIWLRKYSEFIHSNVEDSRLATQYGYRRWGQALEPSDDFYKRIEFLNDYTRRTETTNLVMSRRYRDKLRKRGEKVPGKSFGSHYYSKAMHAYYIYKSPERQLESGKYILNSTLNPFWRKIRAKSH